MSDQSVEQLKRSRKIRKPILAIIPPLVVLIFFAYLWFVSGVLPFKDYYPDGHHIKSEGYVKRVGLGSYHRQGHWVSYHSNGQKASEGFYEKGKKINRWSYWDEDGKSVLTKPAPREENQHKD